MTYTRLDTIPNVLSHAVMESTELMQSATNVVERQFPEASHDAKAQAAGALAVAMAINSLAVAVSGSAENSPLCAALSKFVEGEDS